MCPVLERKVQLAVSAFVDRESDTIVVNDNELESGNFIDFKVKK